MSDRICAECEHQKGDVYECLCPKFRQERASVTGKPLEGHDQYPSCISINPDCQCAGFKRKEEEPISVEEFHAMVREERDHYATTLKGIATAPLSHNAGYDLDAARKAAAEALEEPDGKA